MGIKPAFLPQHGVDYTVSSILSPGSLDIQIVSVCYVRWKPFLKIFKISKPGIKCGNLSFQGRMETLVQPRIITDWSIYTLFHYCLLLLEALRPSELSCLTCRFLSSKTANNFCQV